MPTREAMAAIGRDLDPALLTAAADIVAPLEEALGREIAAMDRDEVPAFSFDPVKAMGGERPARSLPAGAEAPPPRRPGSDSDLAFVPMADLAALIRSGAVRPSEAVEAYAARIEALNPRLNAFLTPTLDLARAAAAAPGPGRLAGVPFAIKDIVETAGVRTTGGSRLLSDHVPVRDSAVWARLRGEGAILLGKTNTQEFAAGPTGENETFGPARNPWNLERMTGGSSSGSAAAVAAGLASAAIGTDTGGSIRIPASLCGVVGLKATYGRVDAGGVFPLSWSLDHVGPIARTVRDAALLLDILAPDPRGDAEAAAVAGGHGNLRGWRVGVPTAAWLGEEPQPGVRRAFDAALDVLRSLGAEVFERDMPASAAMLMAVNRAIALSEGTAWHEPFLRAGRVGEYGSNVRARQVAGGLMVATEYIQAQRLRSALCREFATVWDAVDLVALPTTPVVAPVIGEGTVALSGGATATASGALLSLCGPFNVLGTPALSVPCGLDEGGLPVGLQLVGAAGADREVCFAGAAFERASSWQGQRPPIAL